MADQKINGALFRSMVTEGALAIAEKKEQVNELNVFPVPDGDTGTNMSMTMASAMAEMDKLAEPTLAKALGVTAHRLARIIHAHPTMNEGVMEAAEAAIGAAIHL